MSKKIQCPSCEMAGDPDGDDFKRVTTYHGRPILQCFWCDSHVMVRRIGPATVLDLTHKAIRHLRRDLDHDEMLSLLLDEESDESFAEQGPAVLPFPNEIEQLVAATEAGINPVENDRLVAAFPAEPSAPKRRRTRKRAAETGIPVGEFEPAMPAEAPAVEPDLVMLAEAPAVEPDLVMPAEPAAVDNTPAVLNPGAGQQNTPIGTTAELVSSIPVTARPLNHDSLIHLAAQVGWSYTPVRKQPEWMNFELPPPVQLSPRRAKLRDTINMMKYFRINAGTKEQRRAETLARRHRLVEYRHRIFNDRLESLNAMKAIDYKPEAI